MSRKGVLLVDDEAMALKYFSYAFARRFPVFAAASADEALRLMALHHRDIGVIVTDQRMPESTGVDLLKVLRARYPYTVRILTTAYSELDLLVEAINSGAIYCFVSKPWKIEDLEKTLLGALDHYDRQVDEHILLERKMDELKARILEGRTYDVAMIAAKIGHYVHNALCPVTLLLDQLLDQRTNRDALSNEFLRDVNAHIHEIASTLKDLAQISVPPRREEFQTLDVVEIVERSVANSAVLRGGKNLRLEMETVGEIPSIRGAGAQLEKLFRFMIAEEVVSLPAESRVRLRVRAQVADREVLGVVVEFEDLAPIAEGVARDQLLYPFNLRGPSPREFGVFLASSFFIASHHGGTLTARVKEGEGIVFAFFLPCEPPDMESVPYQRLFPKSSPFS